MLYRHEVQHEQDDDDRLTDFVRSYYGDFDWINAISPGFGEYFPLPLVEFIDATGEGEDDGIGKVSNCLIGFSCFD